MQSKPMSAEDQGRQLDFGWGDSRGSERVDTKYERAGQCVDLWETEDGQLQDVLVEFANEEIARLISTAASGTEARVLELTHMLLLLIEENDEPPCDDDDDCLWKRARKVLEV